jgi:hypothetical protein
MQLKYVKENHSTRCIWNGSTNHLSTFGLCGECDRIRERHEDGFLQSPKNAFGLSTKDQAKLYCMNAHIPWERCTKQTNPSCGCGRLVYNRVKYKGKPVQKERMLVCVPTWFTNE